MTVAAILKHKGHDVISTGPAATVPEIVDQLAAHGIGAVLVTDRTGQLLGIVGERDIVTGLARNGVRALEMTAGELMTPAVHLAHPGMTVEEAMRMMTNGRIRHLPVVSNNEIVGLVSIGDVVKARLTRQEAEVESMKAYIAGC